MMNRLLNLVNKKEKLVIGLMSGTSVDGIDTALVKIKGNYLATEVELVEFENYAFPPETRKAIFELFSEEKSNNEKICHLNFVLGELYAEAVFNICKKANIDVTEVDLVGSHGQTIYHLPKDKTTDHLTVKSTLQIGEGSVIAKKTGIITINDFRVADMAVGGLGAPLVPYPEYLLYRRKEENIALQNIGGIGNVTILPANCTVDEVYAFDTGPGNMIIDQVVTAITNGAKTYDAFGEMGARGHVHEMYLKELLEDDYFYLPPPKTTGREYFGVEYTSKFIEKGRELCLSDDDLVATATALTAKSIALAYQQFVKHPIQTVIVGGGGSYNLTLMKMLRTELGIEVLTQEDLGLSSDAKEAIAFAILANETIHGNPSNVISATGAIKPTILGKIIL